MANTAWNPADLTAVTLSGSNLVATATASAAGVRAVLSESAGKYYFEFRYTTLAGSFGGFGLATGAAPVSTVGTGTVGYQSFGGRIQLNGSASGSTCNYATGNWGRIAVDLGARKLWIGGLTDWNNDTSGTSQNPATGLGGVGISSLSGALFPWVGLTASGDSVTANFGDSAFQGTVPGGFAAGWPGVVAGASQARVMVLA